MDTLIPFLKHNSALDLLIILVVILIAALLIPVGIWIVIASRRRKPIYLFLIFALLPVLLALPGTYLKSKVTERVIRENSNAGAEVVEAARQEAWITTYIGAAGTAALGLIGLTGLLLKKEQSA